MNAGISTITRGFVKKIILAFLKIVWDSSQFSSKSNHSKRRRLIRVHTRCSARPRGLISSTERRLCQDCLPLMKGSSIVSLSSCYSVFAVCWGIVLSGRTFAEPLLAGVWVMLTNQSSRPVFQVSLLHIHTSGLETMPASIVLQNLRLVLYHRLLYFKLWWLSYFFNVHTLEFPRAQSVLPLLPAVEIPGAWVKKKSSSPRIQKDLERLRLRQENWLFKPSFQKMLMNAKAQEPLFFYYFCKSCNTCREREGT